jgi:hypothetical protein
VHIGDKGIRSRCQDCATLNNLPLGTSLLHSVVGKPPSESDPKRMCFSWCCMYSSMFIVRPGSRRMVRERVGIRPGKGMTHEPQSTPGGVSTARSR